MGRNRGEPELKKNENRCLMEQRKEKRKRRKDVGRVKEKVGRKEGRQEEEMKGKLEAGMAGGGSPQLGLQQAVAEENRNISPSHCGPSTCFSSCFIISLAEGKVRTRRFPFSRCGKTADDGFPLQKMYICLAPKQHRESAFRYFISSSVQRQAERREEPN